MISSAAKKNTAGSTAVVTWMPSSAASGCGCALPSTALT